MRDVYLKYNNFNKYFSIFLSSFLFQNCYTFSKREEMESFNNNISFNNNREQSSVKTVFISLFLASISIAALRCAIPYGRFHLLKTMYCYSTAFFPSFLLFFDPLLNRSLLLFYAHVALCAGPTTNAIKKKEIGARFAQKYTPRLLC